MRLSIFCTIVTIIISANSVFAQSLSSESALNLRNAGKPASAENWMISVANPVAAQAGASILRKGGTAADAMVAVQAILGLVEPQSSGLGGGAFLVWFDTAKGKVITLDGRETAPLSATPNLFQNMNGEPLKFFDAVVGGLSVGTPGTPMLMAQAHKRWGIQDWASLLAPAKKLASKGFIVSPRMADSIAADPDRLQRFPATAAYFFPNGVSLKAGDTIKNMPYAETLTVLQQKGADGFYIGETAKNIVATVQNAKGNPGVLSLADLAIYKIKERDPICINYRSYEVCGMGPPSSGALTVGQILKLIEPFDIAALGPDNVETWRIIGDASRLAFADRNRYIADSDFVPVPTRGLIDPTYLTSRTKLLKSDRALEKPKAGDPSFDHSLNWANDESIEFPSTSHFSIVDSYGNALSMTTTIENRFGSRLMSGGFILNNELTDFSFRTNRDGKLIANAIAPGKRPRSSMSPTIVLKDGKPVLVIGSPGGSRIIGFTAQTIIAHLDWGMDIQAAIDMPRRVNRWGKYELEDRGKTEPLKSALEQIGFETEVKEINSGLHGIAIGNSLTGGADPRREGIAIGG